MRKKKEGKGTFVLAEGQSMPAPFLPWNAVACLQTQINSNCNAQRKSDKRVFAWQPKILWAA